MEPRLKGIKNKSIRRERDIFDLDITKYGDLSSVMEEHLADEFKARYKYPLRSFIFPPSNEVRLFFGWKNSNNCYDYPLYSFIFQPSAGEVQCK